MIKKKTEYNDVKGMKEEIRRKKVDQFKRFMCVRENLVFDYGMQHS